MSRRRSHEVLDAINACGGRVKIYQTIRTAHLERATEFAPAVYLYRQRRYDFDAQLASRVKAYQSSIWQTAWLLLRARVSFLEVNEPLMREGLAGSLLAALAVRLNPGRKAQVVSYALENLDPFSRPAATWKSKLRIQLDRRLSRSLSGRLDRLCYGTPGAEQLYRSLLSPGSDIKQKLIPALPAICHCEELPRAGVPTLLFIGDFSPRKGLDAVLAAWPTVREELPEARMVLIGKGQLTARVQDLAAADERVEVHLDPPRQVIHENLRRSHVLVLPSRRTPRWREQVGLPIVEALAHGCHVVTTDETGLASWLDKNGHTVIDHQTLDTELASKLSTTLAHSAAQLETPTVLPEVDGRHAADLWMHREG